MEFKSAAEKYQKAHTGKEAEKILQEEGARWSELLRLPYWDPTRYVVVDGMHNLFLNLVQYHVRHVLGLEEVDSAVPIRNATPKEMVMARKVWANGNATTCQLRKLTNPALIGLCAENHIALPEPESNKKHRKVDIISVLMVGFCFWYIDTTSDKR